MRTAAPLRAWKPAASSATGALRALGQVTASMGLGSHLCNGNRALPCMPPPGTTAAEGHEVGARPPRSSQEQARADAGLGDTRPGRVEGTHWHPPALSERKPPLESHAASESPSAPFPPAPLKSRLPAPRGPGLGSAQSLPSKAAGGGFPARCALPPEPGPLVRAETPSGSRLTCPAWTCGRRRCRSPRACWAPAGTWGWGPAAGAKPRLSCCSRGWAGPGGHTGMVGGSEAARRAPRLAGTAASCPCPGETPASDGPKFPAAPTWRGARKHSSSA